jgi:hypothetical protein
VKFGCIISLVLLGTFSRVQFVFAQDASAAIERWQRTTGIYVTQAVRDQFPSYQADQFAKVYASDSKSRGEIAAAIRGSRVEITSEGHHHYAVWMNEQGQRQPFPENIMQV